MKRLSVNWILILLVPPLVALHMLATDRVPFTSYHMPFPAIGYIDKRADGSYQYVPVSYQLDV